MQAGADPLTRRSALSRAPAGSPEQLALQPINVTMYPRQLADGDHHVFVSGNAGAAKAQVTDLLKNRFGWRHVIDLGDITTARGTEMLLPIWLRLMGALQTPLFNFKVVR